MLDRRESLRLIGSATLLVLSGRAHGQAPAVSSSGLTDSYNTFRPRVTLGNVIGSALHIPQYILLAAAAPFELLKSVGGAIGRGGAKVQVASSNYLEYRVDSAIGDVKLATKEVAGDVSEDSLIARTLTSAMATDIHHIDLLLNDQSLSLSTLRNELSELRKQVDLLRQEQSRSVNGDALYGATEPQVRRTGSEETALLQNEIQRLRNELVDLRQYAARLESFVLQYG